MTGRPRAFAMAVVLAVALLPRTGWIVRSQADLLSGGWGPFGSDLGVKPTFGLIPHRIFRGPLGDPVAETLETIESEAHDHRSILERSAPLLADPETREAIRASVIRQSFVGLHPSAFEGERRAQAMTTAREILALADEGERAHPGDAFYPASAWCVLSLMGRDDEAAQALRRAAKGERYDDGTLFESQTVAQAVERRYGYRGQAVPLVAMSSVLFPHYAEMYAAIDRFAATAPLDDPRRKDALRLAALLARTSRVKVGVLVGGGMVFRAVGRPAPHEDGQRYPERFAAFKEANPGFDVSPYERLFDGTQRSGWPDIDTFRETFENPAMVVGAGLLLATLFSLLAGWPRREEPDERPVTRLRRVPWAWLIATPALLKPDAELGPYGPAVFGLALISLGLLWGLRSVRPGTMVLGLTVLATFGAGLVQPLWWTALPAAAAIFWLPVRLRSGVAGVLAIGIAALVTYAATCQGGHGGYAWAVVLCGLALAALRGALPSRRGLGWPSALIAALYLVSVGFTLRVDAQQGATVRAFANEAETFRRERGLE